MIQLRVSKYDPEKRDSHGRYLATEFTSFTDIGAVFDGNELTADAYLKVDESYVMCVRGFLQGNRMSETDFIAMIALRI